MSHSEFKPYIHIPFHVFNKVGLNADSMLIGLIYGLSSKYGYCDASKEYLAELFQATERSIADRVQKNIKAGYLVNLGSRKSWKLALTSLTHSTENPLNNKKVNGSTENPFGSTENPLNSQVFLTIYNKIIKDIKGQNIFALGQSEKATNKKIIEELFEIFWSIFPIRKKKLEAKKLFYKLTAQDMAELFNVILNVPVYHNQESTKTLFIPACCHPTTFLRNKRWHDDVYENTQKKSHEGGEDFRSILSPKLEGCLNRLYSLGDGEPVSVLTEFDHSILARLGWTVEVLLEEIGFDGYEGLKRNLEALDAEKVA